MGAVRDKERGRVDDGRMLQRSSAERDELAVSKLEDLGWDNDNGEDEDEGDGDGEDEDDGGEDGVEIALVIIGDDSDDFAEEDK